ncbi:MAG TPA: DUF1800 family protein [Steroidobacteraceae bacterium]|jgi:uncharacterized protein (DUF1800 family)|nr:DUF1800 family protein [Steroidobacteraceae bacterium]
MTATRKDTAAAIAANRFGLGARPGELPSLRADPDAWLLTQLKGDPPVLSGEGLRPSAETLARVIELRKEVAAQRKEKKAGAGDDEVLVKTALKLPTIYRPLYIDEAFARFSHSIDTDRPFLERLTQFWTNHFAVSIDKVVVLGLAGAMEREAIRPRVTGHFTDLLLAVEQHPAMLLYLDNQASMGPNSRAAKFAGKRGNGRKAGINENLAREILELHTLGVDGGYTQSDVSTFAEAISGWSIGGQDNGRRFAKLAFDNGTPGAFHFREAFHEPGSKHLLGKSYGDDGIRQGEGILRDLALRRETARHISTKLARHFIADDPPPAAVERITRAWLDSKAHLPTVYKALIECPEAWEQPLAKFKTPADYIYSAYRALGIPLREKRRALQAFEALGQRNLMPGSPAGWPDTSADWDGSSGLLKRVAWADVVAQRMGDARNARDLAPQLLGATLSDDTAKAIARAESGAQALTLLLASPEFMRR